MDSMDGSSTAPPEPEISPARRRQRGSNSTPWPHHHRPAVQLKTSVQRLGTNDVANHITHTYVPEQPEDWAGCCPLRPPESWPHRWPPPPPEEEEDCPCRSIVPAQRKESGEWLETEKRVCAVCGELLWKAMRVREFGNQVASRLEASGQPSSMISRLGRCKGSGRSVGRPRAAPVPGKLKSTACEIRASTLRYSQLAIRD
jgi:hypothetical protein